MKMSTKFTCRFCKEQFDQPKGLYKHLQTAHSAGSSRDNHTCPICGVLCAKYEGYRDHLLYIHGQSNEGQKLTFKSLNDFLLWKTELEIKYKCKYVLQSAPKVLPTKEKKYFYQCDRSGSKPKDIKLSVVMKTCSSMISVVEGIGVFKVEYWDVHSGHNEIPPVASQSELDAAISSVEMVNAIADSDDSFDKSESFIMTPKSGSAVPHTEKQTFLKTHTSASVNNLKISPASKVVQQTKGMQQSPKAEVAKKKSTNTSILYSLASVACGKGISKKAGNKLNSSNTGNNQSNLKNDSQITSKKDSEKSDTNSVNSYAGKKNISLSTSVASSGGSSASITASSSPAASKTTASSSISIAPKTSSGPQAIAPKISTITSNTINSLFTTNSGFPNQLVFVNPVGMDQNTLNSNQNVFTAGQNIVFSLAPVGQNILSTSSTPQAIDPVPSISEKKVPPVDKKVSSKADSTKLNTSKILTSPKKPATSAKVASAKSKSNGIISSTASTTSNCSPITLTSTINNAPVILSSLPVGSTFMSVNNNLIPIASPSGTFLPTSLPPNIVLAPVVPSTTMSNIESSLKTAFNTNAISSGLQSIQAPVRFSAPSSIAVTVSSVVREPIYASTPKKMGSNIVVSSSMSPISSTSMPKNSKLSNTSRNNVNVSSSSVITSKIQTHDGLITKKVGSKSNTPLSSIKVNKVVIPTVDSNVPSAKLKSATKAKKRTTKGILKSITTSHSMIPNDITNLTFATNIGGTQVVNSQLNLAPISSAPNVASFAEQLKNQTNRTLLFESAGDVYMLEPIENDAVNKLTSLKNVKDEAHKIKMNKSVQTIEPLELPGMRSKLQRKRTASDSDDSAIMMKVKCYQLEMKYLTSQTVCKKLKVELTKERLRNAELTGEKVATNTEEELSSDSRSKAQEIMMEIEDKYSESKTPHIYTMTQTSVLQSLYEDLEMLSAENNKLHKELENYRTHDKFYKSLKRRLYDEEIED